jgi:hypothetical protein
MKYYYIEFRDHETVSEGAVDTIVSTYTVIYGPFSWVELYGGDIQVGLPWDETIEVLFGGVAAPEDVREDQHRLADLTIDGKWEMRHSGEVLELASVYYRDR